MSAQNGSDDHTGVTNPENGAAPATDFKGKGKAPASEDPAQDTSMADDDDDDDDDDEVRTPCAVASRANAILQQSKLLTTTCIG